MKKTEFIAIAILLFALVSCSKKDAISTTPEPLPPVNEVPTPAMHYTDLSGKNITYRRSLVLDLNNDGNTDLWFYTQLVGDSQTQQNRIHYMVTSSQYCDLLIDTLTEQTPRFGLGQEIPVAAPEKLNWYNIVAVTLMRKVTSSHAPVRWEGNWTNSGHQFLPFQVRTAKGVHNGWIEMTADAETESLTFYRYAISVQPNVAIKAGY